MCSQIILYTLSILNPFLFIRSNSYNFSTNLIGTALRALSVTPEDICGKDYHHCVDKKTEVRLLVQKIFPVKVKKPHFSNLSLAFFFHLQSSQLIKD